MGIASHTGLMLGRSLLGLRDLIDVSLAEVRLEAGTSTRAFVDLAEFMEEIELVASIQARALHRKLSLQPVAQKSSLHIDRQLLAAAVGNLIQNAFKFSRTHGRVAIRTDTQSDPARVRIEIEDECGGLPPAFVDAPFKPYLQRAADRSGLGLGLLIARQGVEASGGKLSVRDLPGVGCVFTIDLPLAVRSAAGARGEPGPLHETKSARAPGQLAPSPPIQVPATPTRGDPEPVARTATPLIISQSANASSNTSIGIQAYTVAAPSRTPPSRAGSATTRIAEATTPSQASAAGIVRARRKRHEKSVLPTANRMAQTCAPPSPRPSR